MSCKMRWISTVLVAVLLATGAAQAWAPAPRPEPASQEDGGLLGSLWAWLVSLVAGLDEVREEEEPAYEKSGCGMDPDGKPYCY